VSNGKDAWANSGVRGLLEHTTDGGNSWSLVPLPDSVYVLGSPQFANPSDGVVLTEDQARNGLPLDFVMYRTVDGGLTWLRGNPLPAGASSVYGFGIGPSWAAAGEHTAAVILGRALMTTSDAGASWVDSGNLDVNDASIFSLDSQGSAIVIYLTQTCTSKSASCISTSGLMMVSTVGGPWGDLLEPQS
jgi:photosystem II stability/assembly factor-like uncharacterized protein